MTIYGLSQSSGEERLLDVVHVDTGLLLHVRGGDDASDRGKIVVPADDLIARLADPPAGVASLTGTSPLYGGRKWLDLEVRRNEVLLKVRTDAGDGRDIAVGLDDFQDAVEAAS
jgi:hypothetical protein